MDETVAGSICIFTSDPCKRMCGLGSGHTAGQPSANAGLTDKGSVMFCLDLSADL